MDKQSAARYAELLHGGKVIAYPTEAVWGLGCDPHNETAVMRLLAVKKRPVDKGLILVAASTAQLGSLLAELTQSQQQALAETWPGPVTWLIPDPQHLYPDWIKGNYASVAIRVSAHPVVKALCEAFGGPIVSTSANTAGEPELRSRLNVEEEFGAMIDAVVAGELGEESMPSQIRDLATGKIIR